MITKNRWRDILTDKERELVSDISRRLNYSVGITMAFCIELLNDVNANKEADLLVSALSPVYEEQDD